MDFYEINSDYDVEQLMKDVVFFHDSCIKEIVYISGGYVDENRAMNPFDSVKSLIIIFQSQVAKYRTFELKFEGVVQMNLVPKADDYDNIIYDAALIRNNELYYWAEWGNFKVEEPNNSSGTWISAAKVSWRPIELKKGEHPIYFPTL